MLRKQLISALDGNRIAPTASDWFFDVSFSKIDSLSLRFVALDRKC